MEGTVKFRRKIGKLSEPLRVETASFGSTSSKRLHIRDRFNGNTFLIHTGSDISLIPYKGVKNARPNKLTLFATNDSRVFTYGDKRVRLDFGFRRPLEWNFCIAAVPYPTIGAGLLAHFKLVPYLHESRLMDTTTGLSAQGFFKIASVSGISVVDRSQSVAKILAQYPEITAVQQRAGALVGDVKHHILTTGPPVTERA